MEIQRSGQLGGRGATIFRGTVTGGAVVEAVHARRMGAVGEGEGSALSSQRFVT